MDLEDEHEKSSAALTKGDSLQNLRRILADIPNFTHRKEDWRDWSNNPSYKDFEIPYYRKCEQRYRECARKYEEQFQAEIQVYLRNQPNAFEEARLHRHLCITSMWPPLHNRREIINTQRYFFRLKPKEREHLYYLMKTKII